MTFLLSNFCVLFFLFTFPHLDWLPGPPPGMGASLFLQLIVERLLRKKLKAMTRSFAFPPPSSLIVVWQKIKRRLKKFFVLLFLIWYRWEWEREARRWVSGCQTVGTSSCLMLGVNQQVFVTFTRFLDLEKIRCSATGMMAKLSNQYLPFTRFPSLDQVLSTNSFPPIYWVSRLLLKQASTIDWLFFLSLPPVVRFFSSGD